MYKAHTSFTALLLPPSSPADSLQLHTLDSFLHNTTTPPWVKSVLLERHILATHPYFSITGKPVKPSLSKKQAEAGKELYFYILTAIVLLVAVFKTFFEKYFSDLTHLFLRTTLKQRQVKQQLMQNALPSLLFNTLFVIIAAFYIALLIQHIYTPQYGFGMMWSYALLGISAMYLVKFALLKAVGWLFHWQAITNEYIFIVFFVNKIIGLLLLPLVIVAALGNERLGTVAIILSWVLLPALLAYRFILAAGLIKKIVSVNWFHFLLYIAAFEIAPVWVVYRLIQTFLK